jgi:RNA polymerase sigma-70 factor (ECF subfamily)
MSRQSPFFALPTIRHLAVNLRAGGSVKGVVGSGTLPDVDEDSGQPKPPDSEPEVSPGSTAAGHAEELMVRVQLGDMDAYQELVRLYQRKVGRVVGMYHRDREDALEVVQDTFLKVFTSRHTWERRTSFSAWLYRVAINASIDRYRRDERSRATSIEDLVDAQVRESATGPKLETPIERLEARDRRKMIERAISRLPARQREVVSLRYFAELRLEEIAVALQCPLGTVKSNLHKAMNALKQQLAVGD